VEELQGRETTATKELKQRSLVHREELKKFKNRNDELETERREWMEVVVEMEAKLAQANVDLVESQVQLGDGERKRDTSLQDLKTEVEVLTAQLEAERKNSQEREADFERELRLYKERFAKELLRVNAQHDRELKNSSYSGVSQRMKNLLRPREGFRPRAQEQPQPQQEQKEQPVRQKEQPEQPVQQPEQPVQQPEQPVQQPEQPVQQPEQPVQQQVLVQE